MLPHASIINFLQRLFNAAQEISSHTVAYLKPDVCQKVVYRILNNVAEKAFSSFHLSWT